MEKFLSFLKSFQKKIGTFEQKIKYLLWAIHFFGIIGMLVPISKPIFLAATAYNLFFCCFSIILFHQNLTKQFLYSCIIIFVGGFVLEIIGVASGVVFGQYQYGNTLGAKFFGVPLSIGANWLSLTYIFSYFSQNISEYLIKNKSSSIVNSIIAATGMVLLDVLIEQVAIRYDYWSWYNNTIPLRNYLAWWLFAFLFSFFLQKINGLLKNNISNTLLILQLLFFLIFNIIIFTKK